MKKRTLVVIALMLILFAASVFFLRLYEVDLIQAVVVNAMVQQAPPSQEERIRRAFASVRDQARLADREEQYLERLLQISQRLEKTQSIDAGQVDAILAFLKE